MATTNGHVSPSSSDAPLKTADLAVLTFSKLLANDEAELSGLVSACENEGFFYLDLHDWQSGKVLEDLETANTITRAFFDKPLEEKMKYESHDDNNGYKPVGVQSGVLESSRDGFEALRISRTALLAGSPLPPTVLDNIDVFKSFQLAEHYILKSLLGCLSTAIGLEGSERFERSHEDHVPSKSTLLFIHHPVTDAVPGKEKLGHYAHTDLGSLTLLFTKQPGLQVLSPDSNEWELVASKPGYAIVNVGDTLRFESGRRFRSSVHRVLPPEGEMMGDRYSTPYFLRAGDQAVFKDIDGTEKTAEEWHARKFESFDQNLEEQRLDHIATGGMDADLGTVV